MSQSFELTPRTSSRLELLNCPGCDTPQEAAELGLNEETVCSQCGVTLLLVRIDGVLMFLRDGWT
ncbi:MAG: hypothetical protein WC314_24210 [Vulcanimicrobiota bacterium]